MNVLRIENACKKYGEHIVLNNLSVSFESAKIHGIVGRNGSGKTVLFKSICGLIKLDSGSIWVRDEVLGKSTDIPKDVGVIIEAPGFLYNYSAYGNLNLLASIQQKVSKERIREVISIVGLDPDNKKHVGKYSMGMRQRLGIAQAIMENASLLILDEPFNGLDISGVEDMRKLLLSLKEQGKTIIMSSHSSEDISILCDTVHKMDRGSWIE